MCKGSPRICVHRVRKGALADNGDLPEDGTFEIAGLQPGEYRLTAALSGFATTEVDVRLEVNQRLRLDLSLRPSTVAEDVVVRQSVPLLDTASSSVGGVIDQYGGTIGGPFAFERTFYFGSHPAPVRDEPHLPAAVRRDGADGIGWDVNAESRFILGQGFAEPAPESCGLHFAALQFQPRVIGIILVAGMLLQSVARLPSIVLFAILGIVLCWGALLPDANVFERAYNLTSPRYRLTRAPAPRRFAQGLAGVMALAIAAFLYMHWMLAAIAVELLLLAAVAGILFAKFCFGSWLYHNLFARR